MVAGGLFRTNRDDYGPDYQAHLLEQYRLYVASADAISERRTAANNYLLTVNSSLVTLYGVTSALATKGAAWTWLIPIAGFLVSTAWWLLVHNYRGLNSGKFQVIHELEERLPATLYAHEWDVLERGTGNAYKPLTHIEAWIPLVFALLYAGLLIHALCGVTSGWF